MSRSKHHHGDLRAALIDAALAHIRANGAATFSLRDASGAARVTSGAAYRHFRSRSEVIDEVVLCGFEMLAKGMYAQADCKTGASRLQSVGLSYVAFARSEPHLFEIMFGVEGATGRKAALQTDFGVPDAAEQLQSALVEMGADKPSDFLQAWGLAHGLAALAASGVGGTQRDQEVAIKNFVSKI